MVRTMDPAAEIYQESIYFRLPIDQATAPGNSEIQQFYSGLTLFVTGGLGFIGKHLIEKLLRSCNIEKVFVLMRQKKGKTTEQRREEMLKDPIFDVLRETKPHFDDRIVAVTGDVKHIRLGICDNDWITITQEVDIIFHAAATVRFDEKIRIATLTNVRGTREALALGKACKKLRSFVHVSTAYSHATRFRTDCEVFEQFYTTPASPEIIIQLAEENSDHLDEFTARHIKDWPNTYTFTKAIAEEVVRTHNSDMQVTIVRPAIVFNSYNEPLSGWADASCVFGPIGIIFGVGLGVIRVLYLDNTKLISVVPVDFVNNATIAAGWDCAVKKTKDIKIFNISSTKCGFTFRHMSNPMRSEKVRSIVSPRSLWYLYLIESNNRIVYWILSWLLHYIPAYSIDAAIKIFGLKTPKELKSFVAIYEKFDRMVKVFEYFLTHGWNFDDTNLTSLQQCMSNTDKQIYGFEMKTIDWERYTLYICLGLRKYIVKDGLVKTIESQRKQKWLMLANHAITVLYFFIAWYLCRFFFTLLRLPVKFVW